eukprot:Lithocolla_globosa_v1_NODE_1721_length_2379_cov_10.167384.p1 type:complete len:401 gc:universal NODE_1721_length_2379_cov_10.167384:640-1842(+)
MEMNREGLFWLALQWALVGTIITLYSVYDHLKNYTSPVLQRDVIKILLLIPVLLWTALFSVHSPHVVKYLDMVVVCYEAFVLAAFFNLVVDLLGGENQVCNHFRVHHQETRLRYFVCMKRMNFKQPEVVHLNLKKGILLFVVLMPIVSLVMTLLFLIDAFFVPLPVETIFSYGYNTFQGACVIISLVYFFQFHKLIKSDPNCELFRVSTKFNLIRFAIFLIFFQSLLVLLLYSLFGKLLDQALDGLHGNDIKYSLIVVEMTLIACANLIVFPSTDYRLHRNIARLSVSQSTHDAFTGVKFMKDNYQTFKNHSHLSTPENSLAESESKPKSTRSGTSFSYASWWEDGRNNGAVPVVTAVLDTHTEQLFEESRKVVPVSENTISIRSEPPTFDSYFSVQTRR